MPRAPPEGDGLKHCQGLDRRACRRPEGRLTRKQQWRDRLKSADKPVLPQRQKPKPLRFLRRSCIPRCTCDIPHFGSSRPPRTLKGVECKTMKRTCKGDAEPAPAIRCGSRLTHLRTAILFLFPPMGRRLHAGNQIRDELKWLEQRTRHLARSRRRDPSASKRRTPSNCTRPPIFSMSGARKRAEGHRQPFRAPLRSARISGRLIRAHPRLDRERTVEHKEGQGGTPKRRALQIGAYGAEKNRGNWEGEAAQEVAQACATCVRGNGIGCGC